MKPVYRFDIDPTTVSNLLDWLAPAAADPKSPPKPLPVGFLHIKSKLQKLEL